jgi:S-adenosylmethionine decarboxylase
MNGSEWVVEAYGCDPVRLADVSAMQTVFDVIITELALHPVGDTRWHQFPEPGGVTGLQMLAESHLAVHTFPEHASLCLNLFCCTPRPEWAWPERLAALLGATDVSVRHLDRVYATPSLPSPVSRLPSAV